ncbi:MAG: response regulator RpfG family c-di-GMP phosphodiesterase, partial [Sulfurimonas sp.]
MNSELITKISSLKEKSGHFSVLYVEDEEELRIGVSAFLSKVFTCFDVAVDGQDGLDKYLKKKYDIVITDIQMPRMNGIEMISNIRKSNMNQEIIVVSAYTDSDHLTQSIKLDVTGYIIKPVNFMQILHVLEKSIYKLTAFRENELYKTRLESMVEERTKSILELKHQQAQNYKHAIHSLVKMIEARDTYTGGHSERVAIYSRDIAIAMGLDEEQCNLIYEAGILHDVGKIITPDAILLKPSKLT